MQALRLTTVNSSYGTMGLVLIAVLVVSACAPSPAPTLTLPTATPLPPTQTMALPSPALASATAAPALTATPTQVPTTSASTGQSALVAYIKDGNILVWDEATGHSETIYNAGDVIAMTMSDDGQVLAFLSRSVVKRSEMDWYEQSALWAVERNGENPRELVPAEELRELLNASETDSTNIPQLEWIPGTHRLLFSTWKYFVQAEGESHATPEGLYWVDTDAPTGVVQLPVADSLRFVPSPDGQRIALMSTVGLGFLNADGGNYRPDVLTYPLVGLGGSAIPSGVWTQDSRAFLITSSYEPGAGMDTYAIRRVPVDGSPAELLATFTGSHPGSVTFSPNGRHAAFYRGTISGDYYGWFVADLPGEQGWLAIPSSAQLFWQNLHWSPAGLAYAVREKALFQLCPDATQESEVCGEGFELGGDLAAIRWLDGRRFLYATREPYELYFGSLGGERVRIAAGAEKFAAVARTCRNDSEFAAGGEGPVHMSVAPDNLFQMAWRIRNTGTCTWDTSYRLASVSGERLSGPQSLRLAEGVPPGREIEMSVKLIAPAATGTYQGEWQLFAPDGRPFGVGLPVELVVPSYTVLDFPPNLILAEIPAGGDYIAFGEGAIWVLSGNNTVTRIDMDTNEVVATMTVGEFPRGVAAGYGAVWVTGLGLTRIDPLTNRVSAIIPVGSSAGLNGIAAGAGSVWVSSPTEGTVFRIDPDTNQVIATIHAGGSPLQLAITQDAVWVSDPNNPVLKRIDPASNEISAEINLDCATRGIAADAQAIWVACDSAPTLYLIDPLTDRIVARIAAGNHSRGVAISSNGVWVTSLTDETLTVIDPATNQVMAVYRTNRPLDLVSAQGELWVVTGSGTLRIRP